MAFYGYEKFWKIMKTMKIFWWLSVKTSSSGFFFSVLVLSLFISVVVSFLEFSVIGSSTCSWVIRGPLIVLSDSVLFMKVSGLSDWIFFRLVGDGVLFKFVSNRIVFRTLSDNVLFRFLRDCVVCIFVSERFLFMVVSDRVLSRTPRDSVLFRFLSD